MILLTRYVAPRIFTTMAAICVASLRARTIILLLLYFPLGYPKGNGPKARGSPGEKEMKTIVKNEDEW